MNTRIPAHGIGYTPEPSRDTSFVNGLAVGIVIGSILSAGLVLALIWSMA